MLLEALGAEVLADDGTDRPREREQHAKGDRDDALDHGPDGTASIPFLIKERTGNMRQWPNA